VHGLARIDVNQDERTEMNLATNKDKAMLIKTEEIAVKPRPPKGKQKASSASKDTVKRKENRAEAIETAKGGSLLCTRTRN
jgi:hypothetical protein